MLIVRSGPTVAGLLAMACALGAQTDAMAQSVYDFTAASSTESITISITTDGTLGTLYALSADAGRLPNFTGYQVTGTGQFNFVLSSTGNQPAFTPLCHAPSCAEFTATADTLTLIGSGITFSGTSMAGTSISIGLGSSAVTVSGTQTLSVNYPAGGFVAAVPITTNLQSGSIFANVYDPNSGDVYVLDTGLTQSTFDPTAAYFYDLNADPDWQYFLKQIGEIPVGVEYDVVAASSTSALSTFYLGQPYLTNKTAISTLNDDATEYASQVNGTTSYSTQSAVLIGGSAFTGFESVWSQILHVPDLVPVGSAAGFAQVLRVGNSVSTTIESGQWLLASNNTLQYVPPVQPPVDTDGPMPIWALGALGAGLIGVASLRLKKATA